MAEEYKYYAFISYKREDEKQAKWLQNKLEHYKLPTVVRTENPSLPETIYPIFRDTTDLSGGFLAGAIEDALKSSKYLIVVCSPRAAQSQWVCKEVQYFIDSGREKYIIPFIIDGEPNSKNIAEECFPENLRNLSGEKEILGINISEMGRDAAAIKVVARMFDLRFDTLWQRYERSKKIKRIQLYCLSLLVAIIGLVVGAIFIYQNGQISNKNVEIQNQNKLLEIKNDSLKIAFLNLAKAKEDIEQRNQALTKSRDSIVSINSKLIESNIFLDIERKNVTKKTIEVLKEQMKLVAEQAESMYQDGRVFPAYNYIKPFAEKIINKEYPYSPQIASLLYKIRRYLSNRGFKIVDKAYMSYNDSIYISPDLRYNVYAEEGKFYVYDFYNQLTSVLPGEERIEEIDVQFNENTIFYRGIGPCYWYNFQDKKLENSGWYDYVNLEEYELPCRQKPNIIPFNIARGYDENLDYLIEDVEHENKDSNLNDLYIFISKSGKEVVIGDKLYSSRYLDTTSDNVDLNLRQMSPVEPKSIKTINYNGEEYYLIDKKGHIELYQRYQMVSDELLIKNLNNHTYKTICPFFAYICSNGLEYLETGYIISDSEILCVAGQGQHCIYDINTNTRRKFQHRNNIAYCHAAEYVQGSGIINNNILYDVRVSQQITLYDIKSGLVINEYDVSPTYHLEGNYLCDVIKLGNNQLAFKFDNGKYMLFTLHDRLQLMKLDIERIDKYWEL